MIQVGRVPVPTELMVERSAVDVARIARGVREILLGVDEDPDRDGLAATQARVASAYRTHTW